MKRPLQLSLAIALALSGTDALALGLGTIHINSRLNQPLDAEIPVLQGTQGEAEGLAVQLAAAEDFDRVGLNRSRLSVPLEFTVVKGNRGDLVIKVTSKEAIREPFLDFLVEANWPKGRLLREYTVLLDPPVMAPATGSAPVAAAPRAPAQTQPLPEQKPKATPAPAKAPPAVAVAPRAEPAPAKPAPAPAPAPKRAAASGEYTVEAGDTLSAIARETKPEDTTNINQMMLALLKQNPNAFYKDNINALKRGAILRIPSADQIRAVGSASEAASNVHSQIEDWRGGAASKPTLVADTGSAPEPAKAPPKSTTGTSGSSSTKAPNERLALVPPKAGKDSVAAADRPGSGASGSASGSNNAEIKAELARTKEALASREQETGELKSRVKDLEDTKGKTERLISLKDSEIADLQRKLKDLQDGKTGAKGAASTAATTPAVTTPSTTTPSTPAPSTTPSSTTPATTTAAASAAAMAGKTEAGKVSKEDIWGGAAAPGDKSATAPTASTGTTPSTNATPPSATPSTTSSASTMPPSTTASTTTPSSTPTTTDTSATGSTTPSSSASTMTPSTTTSSTTPSTTTPSSSTPEAPKPTASTTPPVKPAATTSALKPTSTAKPTQTASQAWYDQSWVKPAAIGAAALLLLAGLLGMRKRKASAEPAIERGSIAGAFGDSPLRDGGGSATFAAEEQSLRDHLVTDPANLGLHLELLSLLYSERNAPAFEDAAAAMHPHVVDAHQPEWLEAKAMGQELAPHNPLFADGEIVASDDDYFDDEAVTAAHPTHAFDHDEVFNFDAPERTHAESGFDTPIPASTSAFDFDLGTPPAPAEPLQPAMPPPGESAFAFDSLPPIDFTAEAHREIEPVLEPAPLPVEEDEFAGDDGVGTKLDLAKAYLDMGDPEGARSMLEEVLAEGNDTQKGEARKLMAEIR
jgi:pilus assembly protein FimV